MKHVRETEWGASQGDKVGWKPWGHSQDRESGQQYQMLQENMYDQGGNNTLDFITKVYMRSNKIPGAEE